MLADAKLWHLWVTSASLFDATDQLGSPSFNLQAVKISFTEFTQFKYAADNLHTGLG